MRPAHLVRLGLFLSGRKNQLIAVSEWIARLLPGHPLHTAHADRVMKDHDRDAGGDVGHAEHNPNYLVKRIIHLLGVVEDLELSKEEQEEPYGLHDLSHDVGRHQGVHQEVQVRIRSLKEEGQGQG